MPFPAHGGHSMSLLSMTQEHLPGSAHILVPVRSPPACASAAQTWLRLTACSVKLACKSPNAGKCPPGHCDNGNIWNLNQLLSQELLPIIMALQQESTQVVHSWPLNAYLSVPWILPTVHPLKLPWCAGLMVVPAQCAVWAHRPRKIVSLLPPWATEY